MGQTCAPHCQFGEQGCFCTRCFRGPLGPSWASSSCRALEKSLAVP